MSIFDRALHIPAERLVFAPAPAARERVLLPLVARPAPRFHAAVALAALAAAACLCMGVAFARSIGTDGASAGMFAAVFLAAAVLPAGVAVVGLRDALRPGPWLRVTTEGVDDARLGLAPIGWGEVVAVELVAAPRGIAAVRLTLATTGPARFNPFRFGGWHADWARRHRTRTIALLLLDVRAHTLAQTILVLAARHGASVEPPPVMSDGRRP